MSSRRRAAASSPLGKPTSAPAPTPAADVSLVGGPDLRHAAGPPAAGGHDHRGRQSVQPAEHAAGHIFIAPTNYVPDAPAQQGLMIVDRQGRLIWFAPVTDGKPFDLDAQSDRGKPVLTWWQGKVTGAHGLGVGEIADGSYKTIANVKAGDGLMTDLHELNLTSSGTALITAYETTTANLSSVGQKRTGRVFVGHAQEIDLNTGKVLFDWRSLDHVPLDESYQNPPANPKATFDYFHINSVAEMDDGNLLISGRNTWTLYKVDRSSGKVIWRLNGKRSNFSVSAAAQFCTWQHHARQNGTSGLTVFDNAGPNKERQSRGLSLTVDTSAMRVDLRRRPTSTLLGFSPTRSGASRSWTMGGCSSAGAISRTSPNSRRMARCCSTAKAPLVGVRSYRAFAADWVGRPADPPRAVAKANPASGLVVWASWNGATEIHSWTVLAGPNKTSLTPVGSQPWGGFETPIAVNSTGPLFRGRRARYRNGKELGALGGRLRAGWRDNSHATADRQTAGWS